MINLISCSPSQKTNLCCNASFASFRLIKLSIVFANIYKTTMFFFCGIKQWFELKNRYKVFKFWTIVFCKNILQRNSYDCKWNDYLLLYLFMGYTLDDQQTKTSKAKCNKIVDLYGTSWTRAHETHWKLKEIQAIALQH